MPIDPIASLINELVRLPSIGTKSARRLAFHILKMDREDVERLSQAILDVKLKVQLCEVCCQITEHSPCSICQDPRRDQSTICVVESVQDVDAIEQTGEFRGLYHVLHGVLSPLDNIGPDDLKIRELIVRLDKPELKEIIIATNPSSQGEATASYLKTLITQTTHHRVAVTRIASGLPMGSHLEYADPMTLARSILGRHPF